MGKTMNTTHPGKYTSGTYESRILLWRSYLYLSMFQVHILIEVTILKGNDIGLKVRI